MRKTIKFIFLTLFIWILLSAFSIVNAASATIKANKTSATVGDSVNATVTVNAAAWNLKVSGSASGDIIGYNSDAENQTTTKTYTIDTSKAGTYKVTLSGDITDESKDTADVINTSITITVKAKETTTDKKEETTTDKNATTTNKDNTDKTTTEKPKEKSTNANLKTLGVRIPDSLAKELGVDSNKYDFSGFSKNKTSYNVTVPKNVDSLRVFATAADSNAKVKISGNSGFEVGTNNKITIKVTAEDGKTTKTYTIKVTKLAEEEEKPGNLIEDEKDLYLNTLSIEGIELSPEFNKDVYSYTATLADADVNELKVEAEANIEDAKIDVSGNTDLVEGENTINILLTVEDSSVQKIYQIVVNKEVAAVITENNENNNESSTNDIIGMFKGYIGIAIFVIVLMIVAVIVLIILLRKENKKEDEEIEETEEYEPEEYNVYKNDENEFENSGMSKDNFIESLYKQRNGNFDEEDLTKEEKETLEEISKQTEEIFAEKVEGQSVEYVSNDSFEENPLEKRRKRRGKGKHSL